MTFEELKKVNQEIKTTDIKGKDYAEVNQRIKAFRMLYPNGCIQTEVISLENGVCIMKAIILDEEGKVLGTGTAYEKEGSTFINKTSYIENCETSAVGRALGMVGIGIDVSVASYEEVANAIEQQKETQKANTQQSKEPTDQDIAKMKISDIKVQVLSDRCAKEGVAEAKILKLYKVKSLADITELQFRNINDHWDQVKVAKV
ncbi:hypothetical protein [Bacillus infantis]|uniref:hypothetical protein n=1 Tax=Bacillus infantis TaxID=324767 RepID=UPI003CE7E81B